MPYDRKPGFNEVCEACGKDLHACSNCRFFKTGARWDCAETIDQRIDDKARRNYCEWYETSPALIAASGGKSKELSAAERARSDLDRLFGA
jgi:hypothetical protein